MTKASLSLIWEEGHSISALTRWRVEVHLLFMNPLRLNVRVFLIHIWPPSDCSLGVLEGSEIITKRAREYLTGRDPVLILISLLLMAWIDKLKGSKYGSEDTINEIVKAFDSRNKRVFRSETETVYLPFGMVSMKDPAFGIVGGKLKLAGCVLELRIRRLLVPDLSKQDRDYESF